MALIQSLRQQEATQQAALQEAEAKYGSSYPKLAELRGNIAGLDRSIQDETGRIKKRAESDYAVAVQTEATVRTQYDQAKAQADTLNDKAIEYMIVRQEAEESRGLYEDLLKRLKEAGVLAGLKSSNITVVDPGRVPASPKTPNVRLYMLAALFGGFFLGSLGALLLETLDNKISSTHEVEELTGQTLFGATPLIASMARPPGAEGQIHLATLDDPHSTFVEALRSIRTAVLLTGGGDRSRVILVTSSIPWEGKTTISANLAVVLAQSNRRVLLVDLDMRRGALRRTLGLPATTGLSELLAGQRQEPQLSSINGLPGLDILQSGTPPPNPSELLDSKIKGWLSVWREKYDFVVLDGPPLLPVTDARIVHPFADITLLLLRSGLTERSQLKRSYRLLTEDSKHFVGVILNGLRPQDESYYGYYGYRKYSYHYGKDGNGKSE
jgi:capsular exopolysaccharide synthesis family protein